ncbi:MAG: hypothetical protein R3B45_10280 [Bdellovibrionota bacterium]
MNFIKYRILLIGLFIDPSTIFGGCLSLGIQLSIPKISEQQVIGSRQRIGELGMNGGAYNVLIDIDGKKLRLVETSIQLKDEWNLQEKEIEDYFDLALQAYINAAKIGLAPQIYAYRDSRLKASVDMIRFLYTEPKGNSKVFFTALDKFAIEKKTDLNTLDFWKTEVDKKDVAKLVGSNVDIKCSDKRAPLLKYIIGPERFQVLEFFTRAVFKIHPDSYDGNVILEFRNVKGFLEVRPWFIDWDHPLDHPMEKLEVVNKIEDFNPRVTWI